MTYDKPYKSFAEQVDHLINKYGLVVENKEFAKQALMNLSYYDLINGYKECFQFSETEKFLPGTRIEQIYAFHEFDRDLQNVLFKYSVYVETRFKNVLAHVIAESFGVDHKSYLDEKNFRIPRNQKKNDERKDVLVSLNKITSIDFWDNPSAHYRKNHNHIPPWVLLKNATWSDCSDLYKILRATEKQRIANILIPHSTINSDYKKKLLSDSLFIIRKYRNSIAHSIKFIAYRAPEYKALLLTKLSKEFGGTLISKKDFKNPIIANNIYAMILSLVLLLGDNYRIRRLKDDLYGVVNVENDEIWEKYSEVSGIPYNLTDRFTKYIDKIK